jgi:hypothetical protein
MDLVSNNPPSVLSSPTSPATLDRKPVGTGRGQIRWSIDPKSARQVTFRQQSQ